MRLRVERRYGQEWRPLILRTSLVTLRTWG